MRPGQEVTIRAEDLDRLAAKLRQPPTSLSAFRGLTTDQVGLLSDAIDKICARRRRMLDAALEELLPALPRRLLLALLRARAR
jgi:hypothetical protein